MRRSALNVMPTVYTELFLLVNHSINKVATFDTILKVVLVFSFCQDFILFSAIVYTLYHGFVFHVSWTILVRKRQSANRKRMCHKGYSFLQRDTKSSNNCVVVSV